MTSDHTHSFPIQPPHSMTRPGPCTVCGKSYVRVQAERQLREAQDMLALLDEREKATMPGN